MRRRLAKALVSLVIVVTIGGQFFATFRICWLLPRYVPSVSRSFIDDFCVPQTWPFLTYPMYHNARYEGDEIAEYRAYAILQNSIEVQVHPEDVDMGFWNFLRDFVAAMKDDDREQIQEYRSLIQTKKGKELVSLRLEEHTWVLHREGVTEGTPEVISEVHFTTDIPQE